MKRWWAITSLTIVVIALGIANLRFGMWLSGWDNVHPEFNFGLNLHRYLFSVWQEYQGLGTVGGLAYAADLPRAIISWVMSLVLPAWSLRYLWMLMMLWLGTVGVYVLMSRQLLRNLGREKREVGGFVGGLFYLLNLATVQTFFVPFEAFVTHYGFLPWLIYGFVRVLEQPTRKRFLVLLLVNFVAITQAYVPTIFFVYLLVLVVLLLGEAMVRGSRQLLRRGVMAVVVVLTANAFWLLPFGYFTVTRIWAPVASHMNQMSTEDIWLRNKQFGGLKDVALLKGFLFDYIDGESGENGQYLMQVWRDHVARPEITLIGYGFFGVVLVGIIEAWRRNLPWWRALTLVWLVGFVALANATWPFSVIVEWLRNQSGLLAQVFRVPFTKFGVVAGFGYSVFFGLGVVVIGQQLVRYWGKRMRLLSLVLISALMIWFVWPAFRGQLVYSKLFVKIPQEYFKMMEYLNKQGREGRVATFPQPTYWGWGYYNWGFRGSGFLWYGVANSTLDRAFDGYSGSNENYYWEVTRAVYAEDAKVLDSVFRKYQVRWVMMDESISVAGSPRQLYVERLKVLLNQVGVSKVWNEGELEVYETTKNTYLNGVFTANDLIEVDGYEWGDHDQAVVDWGNYVVGDKPEVDYPFRSLLSGRSQGELAFKVDETASGWVFEALSPQQGNWRLTENNFDEEGIFGQLKAEFEAFTGQVRVAVPKVLNLSKEVIVKDLSQKPQSCNQFNTGEMSRKVEEGAMVMTSLASNNCVVLSWLDLPQRYGYLMVVESEYVRGKPLMVKVVNVNSGRVELETYLSKEKSLGTAYLVIPPSNYYGLGYEVVFDNISIGKVETVNKLGRVRIYPIPQRYLESLRLEGQDGLIAKSQTNPAEVVHPNESYYLVRTSGVEGETLVLSQAFDEGWRAYQLQATTNKLQDLIQRTLPFIFGKPIKNHVLVNNWENGWVMPQVAQVEKVGQVEQEETEVVIYYLPQLLEWAGLGVLGVALSWLAVVAGKCILTDHSGNAKIGEIKKVSP